MKINTNLISTALGVTMALTAAAQNPLERVRFIEPSGCPINGSQQLAQPGKATPTAPQHRLGERTPLRPPFVESFDDYTQGSEHEQFERYFQVINEDGDQNSSGTPRSWGFYNFNGESGGRQFSKCAYLLYPINVSVADDWLIPRAIKVEAGKYYRVKMDASLFTGGTTHAVEVKMGEYNDAAGMTIPVVPVTEISSTVAEELAGWFCPEFDGLYYMGIHGVSERALANGDYLFIDNIAMEAARTGREPSEVTDLKFVSDPDGKPASTISFNAPSLGVDGKAVEGPLTVTVKRGTAVIKTLTANPGQAVSFVDEVPEAGTYNYTFTVSNAAGAGCDVRVNRFVGMSIPMPPVITSISEPSLGKVHMTWEAPTTDVLGSVINPEQLVYNIYNVTPTDYQLLVADVKDTQLTYDFKLAAGKQEVVMLAITAEIAGETSQMVLSDYVFVGTPHSLPYVNHFTNTGDEYVLGAQADEGVLWRMLDDFSDPQSQDGDNSYICMVGSQVDQHGELSTGKIDLTKAVNPYVSFYTYIYAEDANMITIYGVDCETGERIEVQDYILFELESIDWTRIMCPIKQLAGRTVCLVLAVDIATHGYIPLDNMKIDELAAVDMSVDKVDHTAHATLGEKFSATARVTNRGAERIENYTVDLYCDGRKIDSVAGPALDSFESADVTLSGEFNAASAEMPLFEVKIEAADDANLADNTSEAFNITFLAPIHPVVPALAGDLNGTTVTLSWSAPDLTKAAPEESFEDFESYPAFTTQLKGFTMIDADGGFVAGFSGVDMPVTGKSQAYWTMQSTGDYSFLYTVDKSSLFAMATVNSGGRPIRNDDWLISPELYGGRQTISFMACSQSINYGYETFEVYASSTTPEIDKFEKVLVETAVGLYWEEFYITLPAGTKYFAIRCTSNDCLLFALDNITYIAKGEPRKLQLQGYNVYRNGEKLNTALLTTPGFTTEQVDIEDAYFVTAVYDKGESTASNVVTPGLGGVTDAIADADAPAEYFNLQGIRVASSDLAPGIYLVRRGQTIEKRVIR